MDFLTANLINTTTQLTVNSNTTVVANLFNRDQFYQYYSDGLNNDLTTCSITITFGATTNVSNIVLSDTNAKQFSVFYNGLTASAFALSDQNTTTSSFTTNTDSNVFLKFPTTAVSSITLDIKTTQVANAEKIVGNLYIGEKYYSLGKIPNSSNYKPSLVPKQIVHQMSDGGQRIHNVRRKFDLSITLDYLSSTEVSSLKTLWELQSAFQFAAFGTSTGWTNPVFFECVWPGSFNFFEYSDDAISSGFSGNIKLKETPV